ncbi:MAG: sterol desaturase family protein, partial [Haliea sp.]|nr:sterol desaturase family protein [Haliea sp.]
TFAPSYLLLVMTGCGEVVLAYFGLVTTIHGIFQHANIQLRLGPPGNWFFSMAELHRWHHSKTLFEADQTMARPVVCGLGIRHTPFATDREPPEAIGPPIYPRFR